MATNQSRDLITAVEAFLASPIEQQRDELDDIMSLGYDPQLAALERMLRHKTVEEQAVMHLLTLRGANSFEPPSEDEILDMTQMIESIVTDGDDEDEEEPLDWLTNIPGRAIAASLICDTDLVNRMLDSRGVSQALSI